MAAEPDKSNGASMWPLFGGALLVFGVAVGGAMLVHVVIRLAEWGWRVSGG